MSDYLPGDVLVDILTRLPAETLVRLTAVCKPWRALITSPKFISHHRTRNADDRLLLVRHRTDGARQDHYSLVLDGNDSFRQLKALDLPFDNVGFSIVGSVNGVICLSDDLEYGYLNDMFLWNPSIRKFVALPTYNVTYHSHGPFEHCLGFGFDPVVNDFKVVRVVHSCSSFDGMPTWVELYTHKTGRWRYISDKALPSMLMIKERYRQAYVNGAANWMAFTPKTPSTPFRNTILSFNMSEEVFKEILVPESVTHDCFIMNILVEFMESLCLIQQCISYAERHCVFWIMKQYGVPTSWSRLFKIDLSGGLRRPLGLRANGEVIFATHDGLLVSFDHKRKHITHLGIHGTFGVGYSYWYTFYSNTYTQSLELLNNLVIREATDVSGQKKSNSTKEEEEVQLKQIVDNVSL